MPKEENPGGRPGLSKESAWVQDYLQHSPVEVLGADALHEVDLVAQLAELGYRPAVQCRVCKSWLVAARSVADHLGPVCRGRNHA